MLYRMNPIQKRFALFLIGCMGSRALLAFLAKTISLGYLPYMGYALMIPAFGFLYLYVTGGRQTGGEVFGEKIWWVNLRPVHGALYLAFAYFAIRKQRRAWWILLADVVIGLVSFLAFHYTSGNFAKLRG